MPNQGCALQSPVLQKAGYRVIAPDLRGYGETDRPQELDTYRIQSLVADVAGKSRLHTEQSSARLHLPSRCCASRSCGVVLLRGLCEL